jgi:hypothetical protein
MTVTYFGQPEIIVKAGSGFDEKRLSGDFLQPAKR